MIIFEACFPSGNIDKMEIDSLEFPDNNTVIISFSDDGKWIGNEVPNYLIQFYKIIASFYNFVKIDDNLDISSHYGVLTIIETIKNSETLTTNKEWRLTDAHPILIDFGYLDYNSDPTINIKTTWAFKECHERSSSY